MSVIFLPPSAGAASVPDATETVSGKIRIATNAEATTGTDDLTAMTPAKVKTVVDAAVVGGVQYQGTFDASAPADLSNAEKGDLYVISGAWGQTSRCRDGESPLPGDIVTVYTSDDRSPAYGNHIVLVASLPDESGEFDTIEGNAHGEGPEGRIEGVIKRTRNMSSVAHIYRLLTEDYEA